MYALIPFAEIVTTTRSWGLAEFAIAVVVGAGIIALVVVAIRKLNITIPDWLIHVFWIVAVVIVIVVAIKLIASI
jgi:hypothetical protein